ncbi:ATP-dependent RNA helicase HrpA [Corynebacterium striatum]|uniref:ATP-dependent RNA helicase HrpA n=1 Tax=Corynebacterium striatum TaxID=43770 RepID=UPI000C1CC475|nr:ATP-dependent RNA helicase HrpA [Corynebacterium striatum]PIS65121.1 ATP-dependent RNA helicase HrpA [Corynebacterium striatum]PXY08936.1 ATP-dependent RNA helicase HrpA [Corynebacterium striatum]PXY10115.1 ATP-dependent RNA helicase HrpA [Corynebacterium striatum]PXY14876.1 ATP-dependent RNA helicase HrpA [Corynebacterium striatum]
MTNLSQSSSPTRDELFAALDEVSLKDARAFRRRLRKARSPQALIAIGGDIQKARERVALIDAAVPAFSYPEALPVSARKDDIADAIRDNQVAIIAGETGSGKTTQIPKICLDLGRGRRGLIGHTQPRRLAARTVAERIADELDQKIGESVGYAIRFDDRVSNTTAIKLMTDGILLAEMQRDRFLNAYDTIIIDEAHERSLNIDFLLGYLKRLLPKRPDLKVIITSATIDPERFATHFADAEGNPAPIIEVSGRTYPVEIRYRPLEFEAGGKVVDQDPIDGLCEAIEELMAEGEGDILCFFPGERDIRDAMEAIEARKWSGVEVTPLFGRLSNEEQHRVFSGHRGRRIVLSTNIAETSLTVPGIRYVVDTGTARISRYSTRTKVQRLPIEPISQASANQRSGRCGRVADGIAIRLYSEQDFLSRPEFTDPEILRTNLASVILQMISLRLGDISEFPFVQSPEQKAVRDGLLLLHELGALSPQEEKDGLPVLTDVGRVLSRIPVDPRMARMLVEAHRSGCLEDIIVIVAAMTIQDVRERPLEFQAQADQAHARFKDKSSDFLAMLNLWDFVQDARNELSGNAFRKRMKKDFLHYMRIREWFDLVRQLRDVAKQLGWNHEEATERRPDDIHMSLLSGLLSNIGARDGNSKEFHGARNTRFLVFPGSALAKKPPEFLMAAELVETSRLWARDVAAIDPAWVEKLGANLLKHNYSDPTWSRKRAAAVATQRSTLYGVPIVTDRMVPYHRIDPVAARDMFIRNALIEGEWNTHHHFFHDNVKKLEEAAQYEDKARRRGLVVDEDTLFDFYDQRIPAKVTTGRHFDSWWKKQQHQTPDLLDFDPDKLIEDTHDVTEEAFPDRWLKGSIDYDLTYKFEPGDPLDGVTLMVPVPLLAGLDTEGFDWLVPGLRLELVTELIRSLPKAIRRTVVPAPEFAERALPRLIPYEGSITQQLADVLRELGGQGIDATDFKTSALPAHLRMNYAAVDKRGKIIDSDRDLAALVRRQAGHIKSSVSRVGRKSESKAVKEWTTDTLGTIDEEVTTVVDGHEVTAYPALVASAEGVSLKVHPTKAAADAAMITTTLTLLMREISVNHQQMVKGLPLQQRVAVDAYPHGSAEGLVNDARVAAIRDLMLEEGGPQRSPEGFRTLLDAIKPQVAGRVRQSVVAIAPGLAEYSNLRAELAHWDGPAIDDMKAQMEFLLPKNAITIHGMTHLRHLPRYMQAIRIRLEEMSLDPDKDADRQAEVEEAKAYLANRLRTLPAGRAKTREVKDIYWMMEELRVSLFAQRLGTAHPVSLRRIQKAVDKLR